LNVCHDFNSKINATIDKIALVKIRKITVKHTMKKHNSCAIHQKKMQGSQTYVMENKATNLFNTYNMRLHTARQTFFSDIINNTAELRGN